MTLAVRAYEKDPDYLKLALAAGGDPNTRQPDNDPISMRFLDDRDCDAIRLMKHTGADIDARNRGNSPVVFDAAFAEDWDAVWCLLELGAKFNYPDEPNKFPKVFKNNDATLRAAPLCPYKVKYYKFLEAHGMKLPDLATGK